MSSPLASLGDACEKSFGGHRDGNRRPSLGSNNNTGAVRRRIIFPTLHPDSEEAVKYYRSRQGHATSSSEHALKSVHAQDYITRPEFERSLSFPKNGLKEDMHQTERRQMLPLPNLPDLKPKPSSSENAKKGLRIRDSICVRKAMLPKIDLCETDDGYRSTLLSNKKWVVQSPQIDSLSLEKPSSHSRTIGSHRTYYPAASVPKYHEPPIKSNASVKQPLQSILRSNSTESLGCTSKRRSSILFRKSSTVPTSPDDLTSSPNETLSSSLTLASPTSIRSLTSELNIGEPHESIGQTESDLNRIASPQRKVIPRQDNKLRRNASDTVVTRSEEEVQQRRRQSIHLEDKKALLEDVATRHESLECLPSHKKISFDPHIWVYEFTDDRHEFEQNGGKWFTEDELDGFKEDAIQRIRQRNMKMMSGGQGRIAMVPPAQDRSLSPSPLSTPAENPRPVVFTHPALGFEDEFDPDPSYGSAKKSKENLIHDALSREMRNVLVVDPHDIFLNLFTKCFKYIIPHISVATARSGEEALSRIQAAQKAFPVTDGGAVHGFDIIIVEERLLKSNTDLSGEETSQRAGDYAVQRLTSGSGLIRSMVQEEHVIRERVRNIGTSQEAYIRFSLLIGVSAYLAQDQKKLKQSGADFVFGKPPPEINFDLRNDMLKVLMKKRNNDCSLFD